MSQHVDYPHDPGTLYDCPACEPLMAELEDPAMEDPAYLAYLEAEERRCGAEYVTGGHDPYGSQCVLDAGHGGAHVAADPLEEGCSVSWTGGGVIAGDRVPYRNVQRFGA